MNLILILLLALAGCNTIDVRNPPPSDFPKDFRVIVHRPGVLGFIVMSECLGSVGGCTLPDFCSKVCHVYLQVNWKWIEDHERLHCLGLDHPRETHMRDMWDAYKLMDGPAFCALRRGDAR